MKPLHDLTALDLNLLVALDVMLATRSITTSARRLAVTQSAMSHTLRRARDWLDDPLLVRSGDGMVLTPRAEALRAPLHEALLSVQRAVATEGFDPARSTRTFRLSAPDLFGLLVVPGLVATLLGTAPNVDVVLVHATSDAAVLRGDVDLAVAPAAPWTGATDRPTELVQRKLFEDDLVCFLPRDHPAAAGGALSLDGYAEAAHVVVSPTGEGTSPVDTALAALGRTRRVVVRVPGFAEAAALVATGPLVLTAPRSFGRVAPAAQVVALPLPLPPQGIAMRWHTRLDADAGHRWFRGHVLAAATQLAPRSVGADS